MKKEHPGEYKGRSPNIKLVERKGKTVLLIDNIPVRYGQTHHGMYFLHEYAFDHREDLLELAHRFVEYRQKADAIRAKRKLEHSKKRGKS